ncbi:uncharacterized protein LOC111692830, partial [Anoplophora glabripennis]|uniref:uncharacterized protein LOC111692830 n=1 Tax=Anoplophora glabripennis TaxID=217634 RepID=UPI000C779280
MDGQNKIGKWSHIDQFYKLDSSEPALRICNKLTDAHIIPSKMNKMKVKNCTQVFSHAVGSLMKRIAQWDIKDNYNLPKEATDTADLILFLDKLFDSLNISKKSKPQAEPLKWAVTKNSIHEEFWQNSLKILDTMKFFSLEKQRFVAIPTLKNLKFTVKGFIYLRQILLIKKKFKFVLTGAFNQDPLENFFSYIRSHGHRYTNPDVAHFCSSFKSLVVNNFMSSHSPGSNCQKDMATECLDNLRTFLTGEYIAGVRPLDTDKDLPEIPRNIIIHKETKIARCTLVYMGGAIIKILLKTKMLKECKNCQNKLSVRHGMPMEDDFIEAREYERAHLMKPGHYVNFLVTHSMKSLFYLIPRLVTTNKIANVLKHILQQNLNFNVLNSCPQHNLGLKLCEVMVRCALF